MSTDPWPLAISKRVGENVAAIRKAQDLRAQDLAEQMTSMGVTMNRSVLANLESGRRPLVSVAELLAFAACLDVPPFVLLAPVSEPSSMVEALPEQIVTNWEFGKWLRGLRRAPGAEQPLTEMPDIAWMLGAPQHSAWRAFGLLMSHETALVGVLQELSSKSQEHLENGVTWLAQVREDMKAEGMRGPNLPEEVETLLVEERERQAAWRARRLRGGA